MNRRTMGLAAAVAAALTGSANAHHGYAQYDRCAPAGFEGEIERISWGDPHIVFDLKADDATTYRVEWINMQQLRNAGLESGALHLGDRVLVVGSLNRNPELKIVTLLSEISRPADGWRWSRTRRSICRSDAASSADAGAPSADAGAPSADAGAPSADAPSR
jgi:hypothetical protein